MAVENWEMPAIGAGAAFLGSIPQMVEARRLKRERDRLLQEGPGGFTPVEQEQMAAARARAASSLAPGYAQEMEGIAQQQADTLAAAKRGSQTGSNMLNVLSRMNAQGQAARRNLAMRGAQAQRQAQSELGSMAMGADARRMQRQQLYERQMAALDAARRQYATEPFMAPLKGAMAFMPVEGLKFSGGAKKDKMDMTMPPSPPMTYAQNAAFQSQYNPAPPVDNNVQRNLPLVPSGTVPTKTGLEATPSMLAAPQYGQTMREYLTQNPLKNTSIVPSGQAPITPAVVAPPFSPAKSAASTAIPSPLELMKSGNYAETPGRPKLNIIKKGQGVFSEPVIRIDQFGNPVVYGPDGKIRQISAGTEVVQDYYVRPDGHIVTPDTEYRYK